MKCPRCGSTNLQKKGKRGNKQRFRCKDCSSSFTDGVIYKEAPVHEKLQKVCSRCGSLHVVRDGKLVDGAQRYLCKDCSLRFSENSTESLTIQWECPYCGGTLRYAGYGSLGQREYKCKNCHKNCSGDQVTGKPIKREYFSRVNKDIECPICSSLHIKKGGITEDGRQKYICLDCRKAFMTSYKSKPKPIGTKVKVIKDVLKGGNIRKLASLYNYSERHIREFMTPFYAKEQITPEQKALIIKFGAHCRVPVNYMAEYIGCSEKMCKKVVKEYLENF